MPYFNNNNVNILVIHIPKTGGTSLEIYFIDKYSIPLNIMRLSGFLDNETKIKNNIAINSSLQHVTYETIIKYKDFFNIIMDNITIITIVRNPYERILSDLFFMKMIYINSSKEEVFNIIQKYLLENNLDNHNIPQYLYVTNNKELIPNIKILHTESLIEDMHNLGYKDFYTHHNQNLNNVNYYDYLNSDSIKLINDFYDYDFKLFNYKKI